MTLPPLPSSQSFSDLLDLDLTQSWWYSEPSKANPPSIAVDATAPKSRSSRVLGSSQARNPAASTPDPQISINPKASARCFIGNPYHNRTYSLSEREYASPDYSLSETVYTISKYPLSERWYASPDDSLSDGGYTGPNDSLSDRECAGPKYSLSEQGYAIPDFHWRPDWLKLSAREGRNLWPFREPGETKSRRKERTKGETKGKGKEKELELEVGADNLVIGEEESLGSSTPAGREAEQQEEVEEMVRSEETGKEKEESVGPSTPTHLNQDSRAGIDYGQAGKRKCRPVDTVSLTPDVEGSPTVLGKRTKTYQSKIPIRQPDLLRRRSALL